MNNNSQRNILVIGNFDVLHPGHIRLLNFAKECGDRLTVAVNADKCMPQGSQITQSHRLEVIKSVVPVDEAFITELSPTELVNKLRPYAVVKGKEFEELDNPELTALNAYGGKLIFGSGEFESNAEQFINKANSLGLAFDFDEAQRYAQRHQFSFNDLSQSLSKINSLNVMVVGEIIVDEYVHGVAVGLSQEDPTLVMTPTKTDTFLGGAAITSGHIKALGANSVSLISVVGEDKAANFVSKEIEQYQVTPHIFVDSSRPTPLKTRYRAGNKTLLRVNQVRQHKIAKELQAKIYQTLKRNISNLDLLVFSDFNYGLLPQPLVEKIANLCHQHNVRMVADSQTSSQVGDISRYCDMELLTPTEREVRVALNNTDDGLVVLAQKLTEKSHPNNLVITLAEQGVFIHLPNDTFTQWKNDRLPAINTNPKDPAGAGDCFLAASALMLAVNAEPWQAFYVGSVAAACQVDTIGNTPLSSIRLINTLRDSFIQ